MHYGHIQSITVHGVEKSWVINISDWQIKILLFLEKWAKGLFLMIMFFGIIFLLSIPFYIIPKVLWTLNKWAAVGYGCLVFPIGAYFIWGRD